MCKKCVLLWTGILSCAYAGVLQLKAATTSQSDKDPIFVRGIRTTVISIIGGMTGIAIGTQLPDAALSIFPLALVTGSLVELTSMSYQ